MKKVILVASLLFLFSSAKVFAESDYVLPYPSSMPGSKFYALQELRNNLLKYWYFGNFAQFTYNLSQSDKFLVEAKTLFEYKQYLLARESLKKSDYFFMTTPEYLEKAKKEKKDISQKKKILNDAAEKHLEVLESLKSNVPSHFTWRPEKSSPTTLNMEDDLNNSIMIRMNEL